MACHSHFGDNGLGDLAIGKQMGFVDECASLLKQVDNAFGLPCLGSRHDAFTFGNVVDFCLTPVKIGATLNQLFEHVFEYTRRGRHKPTPKHPKRQERELVG